MSSLTSGYIETHLEDDLERWFPTAPKVQIDDKVQPIATFLQTLPPASAAALTSLDAKIRSGSLRSILLLEIAGDSTYGFDFVKNGSSVLNDSGKNIAATVWALGSDGSGNYYIVRPNGKVATWYPNSGDEIDPYAQFADVDTFMWAKVRRAALRAKVIDGVALRAEIAQMKDPGVSALFG